jgi:hypothetical protein
MTVTAVAIPAAPAMPGVPPPPVDPAAIAAAIDPAQIAQYVEAPQPPSVEIAHGFFGSVTDIVGMSAIVLVAFLIVRLISAWMLHRSINKSIEAKSDQSAALIEKVNKPVEFGASSPRERPTDDRNGLVLIAIGLAMAGFGWLQRDPETADIASGAALFPVFVGAALILSRVLTSRARARERAADQG